jgi:hypothetical protein
MNSKEAFRVKKKLSKFKRSFKAKTKLSKLKKNQASVISKKAFKLKTALNCSNLEISFVPRKNCLK